MTANGNHPEPKSISVPQANTGEIVRQEFGAQQVARSGETATSASAAQARALVEARYVMAIQRPRDFDTARVRLLKACQRTRFAEVARYVKPVGKGIEGPSIRLAEEAARCMGNIAVDIMTIYDDERRRVVRVSATDLEINLPYSKDVTVEKTVERNSVRDGQTMISQRVGSRGQTVYTVLASDDEILNKENALTSKALRANLLRLVPGDLLEEALDEVYRTLNSEAERDPGAERKKVMDAFASLNVMPNHLKEYLGHDLDITTPAELIEMRSVYTAIKDGEATWAEVADARRKERAPTAPAAGDEKTAASANGASAKPTLTDVAAKAKAEREAKAAAKEKGKAAAADKISGPPPKTAAPPAPIAEEEDKGDVPPWMMNGDPEPKE